MSHIIADPPEGTVSNSPSTGPGGSSSVARLADLVGIDALTLARRARTNARELDLGDLLRKLAEAKAAQRTIDLRLGLVVISQPAHPESCQNCGHATDPRENAPSICEWCPSPTARGLNFTDQIPIRAARRRAGLCIGSRQHPDCVRRARTVGGWCTRCDLERHAPDAAAMSDAADVDPSEICTRCRQIAPCAACEAQLDGRLL